MKTKEELTAEVVELTKKVDELRATVKTMAADDTEHLDPGTFYATRAHLSYYESMLNKASWQLDNVCVRELTHPKHEGISPAAIFCLVILGGFILACILASIGN